MTRRGTLALLAAALIACAATAPSQVRLDKPTTIVLEPAVEVSVAGTDLVLRLIAILSDSRCARGVTCVWAGEVRLKLATRRGKEPALEHEVAAGESITAGAYLISVVTVEPERVENQKIAARDYRVTVRVEAQVQ